MGNALCADADLRTLLLRDQKFIELRKRALRFDITFYVRNDGDIEIHDAKNTEIESEIVKGPRSEEDIEKVVETLTHKLGVQAVNRGFYHFGYQ